MRVVLLSSELENAFWAYVNQDPLDYYFFIFDWMFKKAQSRIILALNDLDKITGLMLIYCGNIVQVRGSCEAIKALLDSFDGRSIELSGPLECKGIILSKYSSPRVLEEMILMHLPKGQESINVIVEPQILTIEDAEDIASLMREAYPTYWSDFTAERLQMMYNETIWIGIKNNHTLASIGVAALTPIGGHIMFIATREQYRHRGYATSIISVLVRMILNKTQNVIIYVIRSNVIAVNIYSQVGFKPYKGYLYMKN